MAAVTIHSDFGVQENKVCHLRGAGVRTSTRGKGHNEGGLTYAKAGSSLRSPLEILEHLPPKPESVYFTTLCSHLHLWLYGGAVPHHLFRRRSSLRTLVNNFWVWQECSKLTNSFEVSLACLTGLSGHMWLFTASQPWEAQDVKNRFLREVRKLLV